MSSKNYAFCVQKRSRLRKGLPNAGKFLNHQGKKVMSLVLTVRIEPTSGVISMKMKLKKKKKERHLIH